MEENKEKCLICPRECEVDEPSCGHGRKYAEALKNGEITEEDKERYRIRKEEKMKNHGGCHHGKGHSHGKCCGRGHHRSFDDMKALSKEERLMIMLAKCGFKVTHNHGGHNGKGRILNILAKKETITQSELQEIMDIKAGSLSEVLSKMEEKDFIKREKDEADKRKTNISITEAGKELIKEKKDNHKSNAEEFFSVLSNEEKDNLEEILMKLMKSCGHKKEHDKSSTITKEDNSEE